VRCDLNIWKKEKITIDWTSQGKKLASVSDRLASVSKRFVSVSDTLVSAEEK
jgi:hypothetical protein